MEKLNSTEIFQMKNFSNEFSVPDAPRLTLLLRNTTQTSCTVNWTLPQHPNGVLEYFRVQTTFSHFLYNKSTLCEDSFKREIVEIVEGGSRTNFTVKNILPFASYKIRVQAANHDETSCYSDARECVTLPGKKFCEHSIILQFNVGCTKIFQLPPKKSKL